MYSKISTRLKRNVRALVNPHSPMLTRWDEKTHLCDLTSTVIEVVSWGNRLLPY